MIPTRIRIAILVYFILAILVGSLWAAGRPQVEQRGRPPVTARFLQAQAAVQYYARKTNLTREHVFTAILEWDGPWPAWTRVDTTIAPLGRGFAITFNAKTLPGMSNYGVHLIAAHEVCHVLADGTAWGQREMSAPVEREAWDCAKRLVRAYGVQTRAE